MVANNYNDSDSFNGISGYGSSTSNNRAAAAAVDVKNDIVINEWKSLLPTNDIDSNNDIGSSATPSCTPFLQNNELLVDEIYGMAKLSIPIIIISIIEIFPSIVTLVLVGRVEDDIDNNDNNNDYDGGKSSATNYNNNHSSSNMNDNNNSTMSMQQLHIDAAALACMLINVFMYSPSAGLSTAMDTLCSQAYGASQTCKMGTYSLTGIAVTTFVMILCCIPMWHASSILIALHQPIEVSLLAGQFIRYLLPGTFVLNIYKLIQKVSQARNEARPMLITAIVTNIVNLGLGYYIVHATSYGWLGAAIARSIANFVTVPTVLFCMTIGLGGKRRGGGGEVGRDDENTSTTTATNNSDGGRDEFLPLQIRRASFDHRATPREEMNVVVEYSVSNNINDIEEEKDDVEFLHHIWEGFVLREALSPTAIIEFLRIGIPGMLQVMFEWVAFEILALMCGILPGHEAIVGIGAHSIIMNVSSLTWTLYQGVSVSGNVRVGNALGKGDVHRAEVASNLTLVSAIIASMINVTLLLTFRDALPWFFTSDPDIIDKARQLILIGAAFQFPDSLNCCVQGVFRGSGRQALAAKYNFVAFYIIGIPLAYIWGIHEHYGVDGLWWGITAGLSFIAIFGTIAILRSDWTKLVSEAALRLR
jgi:Na+-driven multidrug efflux pump